MNSLARRLGAFTVLVLMVTAGACQSASPSATISPAGSAPVSGATAPAGAGSGRAPATPPAPAASTTAPSPIKIKFSQPLDALSLISMYVARGNGYFTDEGIDLEVVTFSGGGPDVQALIAGDVEFDATAATFLISAYQEGTPLVGVVSILNRAIVNAVMHKDVAQARSITGATPLRDKLAALRGLTLGVSRPGSLTFQIATYWAQKAGLTPGTDVNILAVGGGAGMIASLAQRNVDVIINSPPEPDEAVQQGIGVMLISNAAGDDPDLADFLQQVVLARPDYVRDNPAIVRRVVRALVRANRWIAEHPAEEVAALLQPFFGQMPADTLLESTRSVRAAVPADGRMTERGILVNYELMDLTGALKARPAWDTLVTNQYLPQ
jgi:NitT/TauT family transport system substrate-binding protein